MTVLEAMRRVSLANTTETNNAARTLLNFMKQLPVPGAPLIEADEVAQDTVIRLMRLGPFTRVGHPHTEEAARAYIAVAFRNNARSLIREAKRYDRLGDQAEGQADGRPSIEAELLAVEREGVVEQVRRNFFDDGLRWIAGRVRRDARERLLAAVDEIVRLNRGECTMSDILVSLGIADDPGSSNRLYKHHERARQRVLDHLDAWMDHRAMPPDEREILWRVVRAELAPRA
jgi:DNA-directed RNA polymerase specialized sigma24 family protein